MRTNHVIQKQFVEVISYGDGDGFALQRETERLYQQKVLPALEQLLDRYGNGEEVWSIEKLHVEIGDLSEADFEAEFSAKVLSKLEVLLKEAIGDPSGVVANAARIPASKRLEEMLVHYLLKGYLPWWSKVQRSNDWLKAMDLLIAGQHSVDKWSILRRALNSESVRLRFSKVISDQHFWQIVKQLKGLHEQVVSALRADMELLKGCLDNPDIQLKLEYAYKGEVLKMVLGIRSQSGLADQLMELIRVYVLPLKVLEVSLVGRLKNQLLKQVLKTSNAGRAGLFGRKSGSKGPADVFMAKDRLLGVENQPIQKEMELLPEEVSALAGNLPHLAGTAAEIYVANSGLVILAAYLPLFFKNRQLMDGERLKDTAKAIALLHYLVYGAENYEEFECVLSKVLCGLEPDAMVLNCLITDEDKLEADALLEAVIGHWQVLKNTSPEGLRNSFLQREGRLMFINNEWQLAVQKESHDVLMAHLPWNINMIRLPWMTYLLKVDWT